MTWVVQTAHDVECSAPGSVKTIKPFYWSAKNFAADR